MVLSALENAWGGEIFVPKIPSYKITDVATAIAPECKHIEVGMRPGEKIHEEMITSSDSFYTYDLGNYYAIIPPSPRWKVEDFIKYFKVEIFEEKILPLSPHFSIITPFGISVR